MNLTIRSRADFHRVMYFLGVILMAIGLPSSKFLMSVSSFVLLINWLIEGRFKQKIQALRQHKSALFLSSIVVLHIIGLAYSSDFSHGFKDVRIKLPLLFLPLIYASAIRFSKREFKTILYLFCASVTVVTVIGYFSYLGLIGDIPKEGRELSLFISHIRLSLLICITVLVGLYFFSEEKFLGKLFLGIVMLNGIHFMILMQSVTGVGVMLVLLTLYLIYRFWTMKQLAYKVLILILAVLLPLGAYFYVNGMVKSYFTVKDTPVNDIQNLPEQTALGNPYNHYSQNKQLENGNYVWLNISWDELNFEWNKRSEIKFDEQDQNGEPIKGTLIRYLTSKGLTKDAAGIARLSEQDIQMIESGRTTHVTYSNPLEKRIHQIIFEFDVYKNTGNPSGHSVTQRIEFWKNGWAIIYENFWFGVGTGDVKSAYQEQYIKSGSLLDENSRHRAHNQYLTIFIAFGLIGFLWFIIALFSPLILNKKVFSNFFFISFFVVFSLSFLAEDTLETQAGLSFFVFFYCFFLYANTSKNVEVEK